MDLGLTNKRAAVAAGSAGLGLGVAQTLIDEGAKVVICGRDTDRLASAVAQLGPNAKALTADLSEPAAAKAFVEQASAQLGGLDILVPNAGGPPPGTFATTSIDDYLSALNLNMLSAISMCRAAIPAMTAQGFGRVVAITSIGAKHPISTLIASSTARAGLSAFLKVTATEVAPKGVTVNSVLPGLHATDRVKRLEGMDPKKLIPVQRLGDPMEFGALVAFLCSQQAAFITGTAIGADGGAPASLF